MSSCSPMPLDRNALAEGCLPLAKWVVRELLRKTQLPFADVEELDSVALCALGAAALKYDPTRGAAFSTFASRIIWQEVSRHIKREARRRNTCSLSALRDGNEDDQLDALIDPAAGPAEEAEAEDEQRLLAEIAAEARSELERAGPGGRFVLLRLDGLTVAQAAAELGLGKERARQMGKEAAARVKEELAFLLEDD